MNSCELTDSQLTVLIAERCGWYAIGPCSCGDPKNPSCGSLQIAFLPDREGFKHSHLPDYCRSLDAMALARETADINPGRWEDYETALARIIEKDCPPYPVHRPVFATARQHARAFVEACC